MLLYGLTVSPYSCCTASDFAVHFPLLVGAYWRWQSSVYSLCTVLGRDRSVAVRCRRGTVPYSCMVPTYHQSWKKWQTPMSSRENTNCWEQHRCTALRGKPDGRKRSVRGCLGLDVPLEALPGPWGTTTTTTTATYSGSTGLWWWNLLRYLILK